MRFTPPSTVAPKNRTIQATEFFSYAILIIPSRRLTGDEALIRPSHYQPVSIGYVRQNSESSFATADEGVPDLRYAPVLTPITSGWLGDFINY